MRKLLVVATMLTLAGAAMSKVGAQQTGPGGIGGGGMGGVGSGGMGGDSDSGGRGGGRHHGSAADESSGGRRHSRSDSTTTPPKPGEVVKKGRLNLPEGLGGDKVHTAYLEAAPR